MLRRRILPLLLCLSACTRPADDAHRTAQLAGELVACQNDRSGLREQLEQAKIDLARAQARLAEQPATPPPQHCAGRTPSHRLDAFAHEVPSARPKVRLDPGGPDNPEAEQEEAQAVAQALRGRVPQLRVCYEKGLKRNSNLQFVTQVKVQLTVDQSGHAQRVQVSPRVNQDMEECMRQAIAGWQFPAYRGSPVVVEQPINLKVQGG